MELCEPALPVECVWSACATALACIATPIVAPFIAVHEAMRWWKNQQVRAHCRALLDGAGFTGLTPELDVGIVATDPKTGTKIVVIDKAANDVGHVVGYVLGKHALPSTDFVFVIGDTSQLTPGQVRKLFLMRLGKAGDRPSLTVFTDRETNLHNQSVSVIAHNMVETRTGIISNLFTYGTFPLSTASSARPVYALTCDLPSFTRSQQD